jgi:outer membrane protein TolC
MKTFDRQTFSLGFDPMQNLSWPSKVAQAGKVALDEARAAGERFQARKFDVQKKVLIAWADYVQRGVAIRSMARDLELLRVASAAAGAAQGSGGSAEKSIGAQVQAERLLNALADQKAEQAVAQAQINALLLRDPKAPLNLPEVPEPPRRVPVEDDELIKISADMFPEVAVAAYELDGRKDALELARLRWIPDINPFVSFTGTISQTLGAAITLPTTIAEIRGTIRASEAEMNSAEATLRQRKADRVGEYIGLIVILRRAEDRAAWLEGTLRPAVSRMVTLRQTGYETGAGSLSDVIEARRMLIEIDIGLAQSRSQVEKSIVDIECCLGRDIETLKRPEALAQPASGTQEGGGHG